MTTVRELLWRHAGHDVYVVGSGTSLASFDFARLAGEVTIALNSVVTAHGFAPTYHLLADEWLIEKLSHRWTDVHTVVVPGCSAHLVEGLAPRVATWTQVARDIDSSQAQWVWPSVGVEVDSDELYCSHTIAIAGIQLAYKLGARRIYLLGIDGYTTPAAAYWDGSKHSFPVDDHGARDVGDGRVVASKHMAWKYEHEKLREWFAQLGYIGRPDQAQGVWNCSELSTLDAWPKAPIATILRR